MPVTFDALHRQLEQRIKAQVRDLARRWHRPHLADDIEQEVWLRVWSALEGYDPKRSAPQTWIATIARNTAHEMLGREARVFDLLRTEAPHENGADPHPRTSNTQAPTLIEVKAALAELTEAQLDALRLRAAGWTYEQIAAERGATSRAGAWALVRRAKELVADRLSIPLPTPPTED